MRREAGTNPLLRSQRMIEAAAQSKAKIETAGKPAKSIKKPEETVDQIRERAQGEQFFYEWLVKAPGFFELLKKQGDREKTRTVLDQLQENFIAKNFNRYQQQSVRRAMDNFLDVVFGDEQGRRIDPASIQFDSLRQYALEFRENISA